MGLAVDKDSFTREDLALFRQRLGECLEALEALLSRERFGAGPATVGAELEMFLVDDRGDPVPRNDQVLQSTRDPRITLELARYNIEGNAHPMPLTGRPFRTLLAELRELATTVRQAAAGQGAKVAIIGILPTLREAHLRRDAMTDRNRYRALSNGIRSGRADVPLHVRIDGDDPLDLRWDEVTLQGANTSFQVHLRVPPDEFAHMYNAAQLAIAPVLAVSGNSPLFLGHRLWEETRIALFKQAADDRGELALASWRPPSRVAFGHGWARAGAHELFAEAVALHAPLLPACAHEEPLRCLREGGVPHLDELRLHNGTVWTWNRAVYDPTEGGHLRIEYRALPAGPSLEDMVANAAYLLGLTLGLEEEVDRLLPAFPFLYAQRNFFRAAKLGLNADLLWPTLDGPSPHPVSVPALVELTLPIAARGLKRWGVDESEISALLGLISDRAASGITGAQWQRRWVERLGGAGDPAACHRMLELYLANAEKGAPVHQWPLD